MWRKVTGAVIGGVALFGVQQAVFPSSHQTADDRQRQSISQLGESQAKQLEGDAEKRSADIAAKTGVPAATSESAENAAKDAAKDIVDDAFGR